MHVQRVLDALVAGLVAVLLSGCWLQPGRGPTWQNSNPFESTVTAANVASLAPAWSSRTVRSSVAAERAHRPQLTTYRPAA